MGWSVGARSACGQVDASVQRIGFHYRATAAPGAGRKSRLFRHGFAGKSACLYRPRNSPPITPRTSACPDFVPSCLAKLLAKAVATLSDRDDRLREVERLTLLPE
jgi:hypothetical protein